MPNETRPSYPQVDPASPTKYLEYNVTQDKWEEIKEENLPDTEESEAKKEAVDIVNEIEENTLDGDLVIVPTPETLRIKASDTVKVSGLGKHLSGFYYVKATSISLSSSGLSQILTLVKYHFGDSLKDDEYTRVTRLREIPKQILVHYNVGDLVKLTDNATYYTLNDTNFSSPIKASKIKTAGTYTVNKVEKDYVIIAPLMARVHNTHIRKI